MKKVFSIFMALVVAVSALSINVLASIAAEKPTIYSEKITANAGENINIPVYIKNNPGLMGISVILKYNSDELTYVKADYGDVLSYEERYINSKTRGTLTVGGNNALDEITEDGVLFYVAVSYTHQLF